MKNKNTNKKSIDFFIERSIYITYMDIIKMNTAVGYIYVRNQASYHLEEACKMGNAINIPERFNDFLKQICNKVRENITKEEHKDL
jgi:hypothetical protein